MDVGVNESDIRGCRSLTIKIAAAAMTARNTTPPTMMPARAPVDSFLVLLRDVVEPKVCRLATLVGPDGVLLTVLSAAGE